MKHRTVLGSPNWLVKRREPSLNLSIRTRRYHYSRPPRQGSLREGSVRRRERWACSWWAWDRTRNGAATPFWTRVTTAVSPTNLKLPSFWSSWSYLLKVTGVPADNLRRINMIQLSDRRNVPLIIREYAACSANNRTFWRFRSSN